MLSDDVTKLYVHTIQIGPIKINVSFIISPHRSFRLFKCLSLLALFSSLHYPSLWSTYLLFSSPTHPITLSFTLLLTDPSSASHFVYDTWSHPPLSCHLPTHSASHSQRWGAQTQSDALLPGGGGSASKSQGLFSTFSIFLWRIGTPFKSAIINDSIDHITIRHRLQLSASSNTSRISLVQLTSGDCITLSHNWLLPLDDFFHDHYTTIFFISHLLLFYIVQAKSS